MYILCFLGQEDQTEVIYSDPLDALEKATDTRIYDCPEYGEDKVDQEEVIYEEAGKKLQQINVQVQSSPKRRKRATVSALGNLILKFIYSEKATKFCEISATYLTGSK